MIHHAHRIPSVLQPPTSAGRRVLSREAALALGQKLFDLLGDDAGSVERIEIEHTAFAVTKITKSTVLDANDGDRLRITFASQFGSGLPVEIAMNQQDDTTLRRVIARAKGMIPPRPPQVNNALPDPDDPENFMFNARPFPTVALWHDTTIQAMETARGDAIPAIVAQLHASGLQGTATIGLSARSTLYLYKRGLTAFAEATDSEVTVTARTPDNTASGWSGQAHRDWAHIAPSTIVANAVNLAQRSRGAVALEPGRRVAILGPAAVAQLVYEMASLFNAEETNVAHGGGTPFTYLNHDPIGQGRHTRLGLRVFDPRLVMTSDPADPEGGFAPFFEDGGIEGYALGFPTPAKTWIDHGILHHLAYPVYRAIERRLEPCDYPRSVRLDVVPGTPTATIDEMIAQCREGIYVNRLSDVSLIDRPSGLMTGVTRDGCFLVKNGKITKAVKNFRFTHSPFIGFNQLEMIGQPERVAFGYTPPRFFGGARHWPRLPVIVPPMMIRDFNFSSLSSAV